MKLLDSQLGRVYLETYYPSVFDENSFLKALTAFQEAFFQGGREPLDINTLVRQYGLSHETVENAAILFHLLSVAEEIDSSSVELASTILDVGGGPTIYQHIPFSLIARNIIHADLIEKNRKEVTDFFEQKPEAYDWDAYFRVALGYVVSQPSTFPHLCKRLKESSIEDVASWQSRVRQIVVDPVVPCDVFIPGMEIEGGSELSRVLAISGAKNGVNVATSHFLLESATDNMDTWRTGLNHISSLLLPGGFLSMMAIRHAEWYRSGESQIPAVSVDEIILKQELERAGFSLHSIRFFEGSNKQDVGYDGMVFLLARKHVA